MSCNRCLHSTQLGCAAGFSENDDSCPRFMESMYIDKAEKAMVELIEERIDEELDAYLNVLAKGEEYIPF